MCTTVDDRHIVLLHFFQNPSDHRCGRVWVLLCVPCRDQKLAWRGLLLSSTMFWDSFSLRLEHTVEARLAGPAIPWNHPSSPPPPTIGVTAFPESGPHACAASLLPPEKTVHSGRTILCPLQQQQMPWFCILASLTTTGSLRSLFIWQRSSWHRRWFLSLVLIFISLVIDDWCLHILSCICELFVSPVDCLFRFFAYF